MKASNNDGIWNEAGKAIGITIIPPWWQTRRFRLSGIIIVILLIFTIYKIRTYRIRERSKQLEEINARLNIQITERQRAEEELLFKNTLLETQKESSIDGILVVGDDRKVISAPLHSPTGEYFGRIWFFIV